MDAAAQPMDRIHVYYATNRRHHGLDRWQPTEYGIEPSKDGTENLRFGVVTLPCDGRKVAECLDCGTANDDIRQCIDGLAPDSAGSDTRARKAWLAECLEACWRLGP